MSDESKSEMPNSAGLEGLILTSKGKPFSDLAAASKRRLELLSEHPDDSYNVLPYQGGYAVIKTVKTPAELKADQEIAERAKSGKAPLDDGESEYVRVIFDAKTD